MNSLTTTDRLKELLPQLFSKQQRQGNYYLRFQLTDDINLLLDLGYVQESLTIDANQITAVPNLPQYTVGLMTARNQVFLALDLAHLAGFAPETLNQRQYQTIVVSVGSSQNTLQSEEPDLYGLTVKRIQGVSRILPEQFKSSMATAPELLQPFIKGSIQESSEVQDGSSGELQSWFLLDLARLIMTQVYS
ncbi:MAG: chemotaxis protein CheW [Cyanobacteria bacterium J06621_12]